MTERIEFEHTVQIAPKIEKLVLAVHEPDPSPSRPNSTYYRRLATPEDLRAAGWVPASEYERGFPWLLLDALGCAKTARLADLVAAVEKLKANLDELKRENSKLLYERNWEACQKGIIAIDAILGVSDPSVEVTVKEVAALKAERDELRAKLEQADKWSEVSQAAYAEESIKLTAAEQRTTEAELVVTMLREAIQDSLAAGGWDLGHHPRNLPCLIASLKESR